MGRRAKVYLRFGELPKGKSRISDSYRHQMYVRTGAVIPEFESGISVFETYWSNILGRWVLPETHGTAASAGEAYSSAVDGDRRILLVKGRRGRGSHSEGSDGEPLLVPGTVEIVSVLKPAEVWEEAGGVDIEPDEGMSEGERRVFIRELYEKLRVEARQQS